MGGHGKAQAHHHAGRSEEHTSELQSRLHLVCRLLLEKKNTTTTHSTVTCIYHLSITPIGRSALHGSTSHLLSHWTNSPSPSAGVSLLTPSSAHVVADH